MKRWKKEYSRVMNFIMAIVMMAVFIMPNQLVVKAGGYIDILEMKYYNTNPPTVAIQYLDPSGETKVKICVVSKTDNGSGLGTVTIDGQKYNINSEGTTNATVEKDNGDGTKNMSAEVNLSSGSGSKLPEGTEAKLYVVVMHGDEEIGWSIRSQKRNEDIVIPKEGKSTDDPVESELTAIAPPTGKTLTYNINEQIGVPEGTGYTLSGTVKATNAGSYNATAKLQNGYKWTDGTTADKTISWTIEPAKIVSITLEGDNFEYTGKVIEPAIKGIVGDPVNPSVENINVSYPNATEPGNYTVTVTGKGNFTGSASADFTIKGISRVDNPTTIETKDVSIKYTVLKKKAKTVKPGKIYVIKDKQGELTFEKVKVEKKRKKLKGKQAKAIQVDPKTGKITIKKKGLKKGTYKVHVKITSKGNDKYLPIEKTVKIIVKIK